MVNVETAGQAGGRIAVLDAELAAGAVAIGVHRGLGHAEFPGDLLRRQVLVDEAQALALARREQPHAVFRDDLPLTHDANT